ncbi:MAG: ferritin [Proteobacteria bacterium]|nr:ferritin [Pseudomonadota bacterium]
MEAVCYTLEGALEKAIEQEQHSFEMYRQALKIVKDKHAQMVLKEMALEELQHKHTLEKALIGEIVALHDEGESTGSPMNLGYLLQEKPLDENSSPQDVMVYAIHDEKRSVDFYKQMASQCAGAPMEKIFSKLGGEESTHLARLEETYEKLYMSQM